MSYNNFIAGAAFSTTTLELNGALVKIQMWDTGIICLSLSLSLSLCSLFTCIDFAQLVRNVTTALPPCITEKLVSASELALFAIRSQYCAAGAFVVYDVMDPPSFEKAKTWILELKKNQPSCLIMLLGNKIDCRTADGARKVKDFSFVARAPVVHRSHRD